MKNIKMLEKLFVLVISIGLIFAFSNFAYAADEDPFFEITPENTSSNESTNESTNTSTNETANTSNNNTANTDSNNSLFSNTESNNTVTNNNNSTLTTNNGINNTNTSNNVTNRSVTNTETLAKTGLSDSKGMLSLIVVLCGISAIYSYKKINDYKKL